MCVFFCVTNMPGLASKTLAVWWSVCVCVPANDASARVCVCSFVGRKCAHTHHFKAMAAEHRTASYILGHSLALLTFGGVRKVCH